MHFDLATDNAGFLTKVSMLSHVQTAHFKTSFQWNIYFDLYHNFIFSMAEMR